MIEEEIYDQAEYEEQPLIKPYAIKKEQNGEASYVQWRDLPLRSEVMEGIEDVGFEYPSQIQYRVIPQILSSKERDILCQAKHGSGKTAVYILSILNMLSLESDGDYLSHHCIIAVNTRQLAHQIFIQLRKLCVGFKKPPIRIASYFGGLSLWDSKYELKTRYLSPHIIIGTLGRLRHLISQNHIRTDHVQYFVIDQCDRILDNKQNLDDLKFLLRSMSKTKQLLLFTATLNQKTRKNCQIIMRKSPPPFILELQNKKVNSRYLTHYFKQLREKQKIIQLCRLLDTIPFNQAIIFCNIIQKAMLITEILRLQMFNPICIHSKLPQSQRIKLYDFFRENEHRIMVATDIFGRGIDIQNVNLVINYDFPKQQTMYMHRAARTGRFGKKGIVISFVRAEINQNDKNCRDQLVLENVAKYYQFQFQELPKALNEAEIY